MPSVVIHTTKEFGKSHIDETNLPAIQDIIIERIQKLLPGFPMPSQIKFHKWRYSQVKNIILKSLFNNSTLERTLYKHY